MYLETFRHLCSGTYVVVPIINLHTGYCSFDYTGMTANEIQCWKDALTVAEIHKRIYDTKLIQYLWGIGVRAISSKSPNLEITRKEHMAPYRVIKK